MKLRTKVVPFLLVTLLAVLAGVGVGAAELAARPGGGAAVDSPHLGGAPEGEPAETPHLAAAAADTPHLPAARLAEVEITDDPKTPEELLARMAKAREAIRTVDVRYRTTETNNWDAPLNAEEMLRLGVPLPEGRSVQTSEDRLCLDGRRWRMERRHAPCRGPLGPQPAMLDVEACDGVVRRGIRLWEGQRERTRQAAAGTLWDRVLPNRPQDPRFESSGRIGPAPDTDGPGFHAGDPPEFYQGPGVHPLAGEFGHISLRPPDVPAGETCYRLIVEIAAHRYTYYVEPEYHWAPIRMVQEVVDPASRYLRNPADGLLCPFPLDEQDREIHYRQDRSGLWYPCDWTWRFYAGYGPDRQLSREIASVVDTVVINGPLADAFFTVDFPDGLPVTGTRHGMTINVTWDSSLNPEELDDFLNAAARRTQASLLASKAAEKRHLARRLGIDPLEPGERVPALDLTALDGGPVALADLRGQWVLLAFWNAADADSVAVLPGLKELHDRFAATGRFRIIGLSTDAALEFVTAAVEEHELPWTQVWLAGDAGRAVREAYGVRDVPRFFLVAPDGYVDAASADVRDAVGAVEQALADPDDESAQ